MENPIKMDDLGGTTIFGNIHLEIKQYQSKNKSDRSFHACLTSGSFRTTVSISQFW